MSKEKKSLSAKQYLSQLEFIDEQINQDLERLEQMKADAYSTGGIDYSRERVQTSPVGDKLCSDVSRYIAFNEQINAEIDRFVDAKEQIIREIRELHNIYYVQILFKVYVQFKSLKAASQEMKRSYNFVLDVHKKALAAFEETHENLTYLC
ncbi:hypothetical protein [Sporofaciens sp. SGI.106]|uniref:hypothetical protein n=1 Tax=Sporofaciens sp. SGI.106 TaxID=3420568 RepID=UPI003CFFE3DB